MAERKKDALFSWMTRFFRKLTYRQDPHPPERPYAGNLVPINRGPKNRSGAIALEEPVPPANTNAKGRSL